MTTSHSESTVNHPPENWNYADEAAMNAATGFVAGDIGRWAYVAATGNYHRLNAVDGSGDPTWGAAIGAGAAPVYSVDFVVGSETGGNTINVSIQLQIDGVNAAEAYALPVWLSANASGQGVSTNSTDSVTATSGSIVFDGLFYAATNYWTIMTTAAGAFAADIVETAAVTMYLAVALPDGTVAVSGAITFV